MYTHTHTYIYIYIYIDIYTVQVIYIYICEPSHTDVWTCMYTCYNCLINERIDEHYIHHCMKQTSNIYV